MNGQFVEKLQKLNTGRIGSFGEYLFEHQCTKNSIDVKRHFRERTDFLVGHERQRVDVKTSLKYINRNFDGVFSSYGGTKLAGISYICTNFYNDKIVFSCEGRPYFKNLNILVSGEVENLFLQWKSKRKDDKILESDSELEQQSKQAVREMKTRIEKFFNNAGCSVKIIYRTCQRIFGPESPGNLLPYVKNRIMPVKDQIKVFVDYNDPVISDDNIFQVIAFPEERYRELPLLELVHVNSGKEIEKVDLDRIDSKFIFISIDDLLSDNYKKMFR